MTQSPPQGHLALPAQANGQAILLLHAWWGLNETIKTLAQRLADEGFTVFAPDLYDGQVTDQISEAEKLTQALDGDVSEAKLALSQHHLQQQPTVTQPRITVIGFSLGAYFALRMSQSQLEAVGKVILFYGTGPTDGYAHTNADYLGHFASDDPFEPQTSVDALETALREAGRSVTFHQYPNTGHWFFEPDRADAYQEAASQLAWERTLAFLNR